MAQKQREYRAKRKILKNANISDRKGRNFDVNELVNIRKELKKERSKN
jgi:pantothenate kinase